MRSFETIDRFMPQQRLKSPELQAALDRCRFLWFWPLMLPFVYSGVARLVETQAFLPKHRTGFLNVTTSGAQWAVIVLGLILVCLAAPILLMAKKSLIRRIAELPPTKDEDVKAAYLLRRGAFRLLVISDSAALLGLVGFFLTANWRAMILGALLSYAFYLQARPSAAWFPERLRDGGGINDE